MRYFTFFEILFVSYADKITLFGLTTFQQNITVATTI